MAFYTVAHILQNGDMYGGSGEIPAAACNDYFWDYVVRFEDWDETKTPGVSKELADRCRNEFRYGYSFDPTYLSHTPTTTLTLTTTP